MGVGDDLLGKPFLEDGRDPATGIDCYGVTLLVCNRLGKPLQEAAEVLRREWQHGHGRVELQPGWERVIDGSFELGDVVMVREGLSGAATHVGAIETPGWLMHATRACGVIRTRLEHLVGKIEATYRWKQPSTASTTGPR